MTNTKMTLCGFCLTLFALASACAFQDDPDGPSEDSLTSLSQPIINGIATDQWPAVGALVLEPEYGRGGVLQQFCSGTLIDPEWVMTAGHCVAVELPTEIGGVEDMTADMVSFFIGTDVSGEGELYEFDRFVTCPGFNPNAPLIKDIALAHLSTRVPAEVAEPMVINSIELTWAMEGTEITWVGYGVTDGYLQTGNGIKRYGTGLMGPIALDMLAYEISEDGQLPCNGDSGGATLMDFDGEERVIGVTHMGDGGCTRAGLDTRVDRYYDWLQQTLETTRPCSVIGGDCEDGETCQLVGETFECLEGGTLNPGEPCEVAAQDWPPYPCVDGAFCSDISIEVGGIGAACYQYCLSDDDCSTEEACLLAVLEGQDEIGACVCRDDDGDGACLVDDCDDGDATRHPSAAEICDDGIDNNCNGLIDREDSGPCGADDEDGGCSMVGSPQASPISRLRLGFVLVALWLTSIASRRSSRGLSR